MLDLDIGSSVYLLTDHKTTGAGVPAVVCGLYERSARIAMEREEGTKTDARENRTRRAQPLHLGQSEDGRIDDGYQLVELLSSSYVATTKRNVEESDGTIRIPAKTVVKFRVAKVAKDAVLGVKKSHP
jgi:hypothetical protein